VQLAPLLTPVTVPSRHTTSASRLATPRDWHIDTLRSSSLGLPAVRLPFETAIQTSNTQFFWVSAFHSFRDPGHFLQRCYRPSATAVAGCRSRLGLPSSVGAPFSSSPRVCFQGPALSLPGPLRLWLPARPRPWLGIFAHAPSEPSCQRPGAARIRPLACSLLPCPPARPSPPGPSPSLSSALPASEPRFFPRRPAANSALTPCGFTYACASVLRSGVTAPLSPPAPASSPRSFCRSTPPDLAALDASSFPRVPFS